MPDSIPPFCHFFCFSLLSVRAGEPSWQLTRSLLQDSQLSFNDSQVGKWWAGTFLGNGISFILIFLDSCIFL